MKKLLLILFLLCSFLVRAQDHQPSGVNWKTGFSTSFGYYLTDSTVWIFKGSTYGWTELASHRDVKKVVDSLAHLGYTKIEVNNLLSYKLNSADSLNKYITPYYIRNYLKKSDTTLLVGTKYDLSLKQNKLINPLVKADTATLLATHYNLYMKLNTADTSWMLNPYAKNISVALKLNKSDTSAMLNPYASKILVATKLNKSDTASMLNTYINNYKLYLALLGKLNISDTSAMLLGYNNRINQRLKLSDTAAMLQHYAKIALVNTKVNIADTSNMLIHYAKKTEVALKVNISDTANMLLHYLKLADIAGKKDKTDSTAGTGYTSRDRLATQLRLKPNWTDTTFLNKRDADINSRLRAVDIAGLKQKSDSVNGAGYFTNYKATTKADLVGGKVPLSQMNDALLGAVKYQDNYNATTDSPTLPTAATANKGWYYVVSVAGTQQGLTLKNGDWVISNGIAWGKVDNNNAVTSVNSKVGAVSLNTDDVSEGTTNKYDKTVALSNGTGISVTGTYPNFTITNSAPSSGGTVTSVSGISPIVSSGGNTPAISINQSLLSLTKSQISDFGTYEVPLTFSTGLTRTGNTITNNITQYTDAFARAAQNTANTTTTGLLTSTDWNTFNNKISASGYLPLSAGSGQALTGTLYGTGATFSGVGTFGTGTAPFYGLKVSYTGQPQAIFAGQVASVYGFIGDSYYYNSGYWRTPTTFANAIRFNNGTLEFTADDGLTANTNYTPSPRLSIAPTGAATFSSSVSATSMNLSATTASTSSTTGSLVNAGGFGNAGNGYFGGAITVAGTGNSSFAGNVGIGYSSGTEITNNKLAVNGNAYVGGNVTAISVNSDGDYSYITSSSSANIHGFTTFTSTDGSTSSTSPRFISGWRLGYPNSYAIWRYDGSHRNPDILISNTGIVTFGATISATGATFTTGASVGKVWTSDSGGTGSWAALGGAAYKGQIDGSTGSGLADGTGTTGWYYACSTAGTHNYGSGNITLAIGDQLYYNGSIWLKIPGAGSYTLPTAAASTLGGVKIGSGVSISSGVISVSTDYAPTAGSSSITTLGTISSGVWNGTAISDSYISSASTWNAKESALTFSTGLSRTGNTITNTITQYTTALARGAVSFTAGSGAYNSTTGVFTIPTNTNQLTNGAGYITGYTETDPNSIHNQTTQQTSANFNIDGNGALGGSITAAGGGFNSLRNLKNIQADWKGSALIELMKFKPRVFNYKQRPNVDTTFAFIIDELPVSIRNYILMAHGSAINIYSLHGFEIKAIQELVVENNDLKARIEKLEKAVYTLTHGGVN